MSIIIQRVGRWESNDFMEYIREQVESFTYHLSNPAGKNNLNGKENQQSWKGDGERILTPHLANFSFNSLVPQGHTKFQRR